MPDFDNMRMWILDFLSFIDYLTPYIHKGYNYL
jgi:hypothetical protein